MRNKNYETDQAFAGKRYSVRGYRGIAFYIVGWETEPISEWSCECGACGFERCNGGGVTTVRHTAECDALELPVDVFYSDEPAYERTGNVVAIMVGDDTPHVLDIEDCTELGELDYCHVCGQIGCSHDGLDRSELAECES